MSEKPEQAPQRPSDFQPIDDPKEAEKLLREGTKTLAAAMIWTKNQEQVINTHLTVYSDIDKVIYVWIPKDVTPAHFEDAMAKAGVKDCFFSVSLSRANIFFKAAYKGWDTGGMKFKIPEKVFKVQRRKDMRFSIPDGHVLKVEFQDPLFPETLITKKVMDISASGIAFVVDESEQGIYTSGLILKDVSFTVKGRKILANAEVKHSRPVPEGSKFRGIKIGVVFTNIKPGESQHIAGYVFEESRKFLSRFI